MIKTAADLKNGPTLLADAVDFANHVSDNFELVGRNRSMTCIVIEELVANCIAHGALPESSAVSLEIVRDADTLHITMRDSGLPFDPYQDLEPLDLHANVNERRIGGLGWPIIFHYCRIVDYQRNDGRNRLSLAAELC